MFLRSCALLAEVISVTSICFAVHAGEPDADNTSVASQSPSPSQPSALQFLSDGTLQLYFRNYSEHLEIAGSPDRDAWVQSGQAVYESGFTDGAFGLGFDASLFSALKLNGGKGAGNMVHVGPDYAAANQTWWAYAGRYAIKARLPGGTIIKYGLQTIVNPFLEPYDIRALPPTFRGVSFTQPGGSVTLSGGRFDAVNTRGATRLQPLSTSYGGVEIDQLIYLGGDWKIDTDSQMSLYANRARDVWDQYYLSAVRAVGKPDIFRMSGQVAAYYTRNQGASRQGLIDNRAYSTGLSAEHQGSIFLLSYQRVVGDQFFDFMGETCGIYLANAVGNDFNAPRERSVQMRIKIDGGGFGMPGAQISLWKIRGWGADGSVEAGKHTSPDSLLHGLYWKAGRSVGGGHTEYGFKSVYSLQGDRLKGANVALLLVAHNISQFYPSKRYRDARLMLNVPFTIF